MANAFSAGKKAVGICDRCGFRYPLNKMKTEVVDSRTKNNLVCRDCFDTDHPQWKAGRKLMSDPQSVRNPRPDTALMDSRSLGGFNPLRGNQLSIDIGSVTVV